MAHHRDSGKSVGARLRLTPAEEGQNELVVFSESLDAVVDHDGDHAHGYGDNRHADQDGPDTSKANGAKHENDLSRRVRVPSISRLR
jgi:hypothetical protein